MFLYGHKDKTKQKHNYLSAKLCFAFIKYIVLGQRQLKLFILISLSALGLVEGTDKKTTA